MPYPKITQYLAQELNLSQRQTQLLLKKMFNYLISQSLNGPVVISGYGRFRIFTKTINSRFYKGPSWTISFKPSRALKLKLRKIFGDKT